MALKQYNKKRHFDATPEPEGKIAKATGKLKFVIQRHEASRLHYDFRLQADGTLKSWAVPKGPSMNPDDRRLAVMVEDHPVSYASFEGDIPKGNYGAGHVDIWDNGRYEPHDEDGKTITEKAFLKQLKTGHAKFRLFGKKLQGSFVLVQMKGRGDNNWLLIKHRDEYAVNKPYDSEDYISPKKKSASKKTVKTSETKKEARKKPALKKLNQADEKTLTYGKVKISNPDKIYFPDDGFTKGDVVAYYEKIARYMVKYLKNRPQSLRRNPNGIKDEGFFHKDVGGETPDWIDTYSVWSESSEKTINYMVCNNKASLLYMANLGCIEINPWNSRTTSPDNPDYVVLDLDPSEKNSFDQVIETAQVIHEILEKAGCANFCKTSGASGLHIYIPLGAQYDYEQARMFAEMIAALTVEKLPDFTTVERSLKKRKKDEIYVDYLQNRTGQTLCSVYSLRPKPSATVSTPLEWKEVKPGLDPQNFHIGNILERLEKKGDLFAPVLKKGIRLDKVLEKLEA